MHYDDSGRRLNLLSGLLVGAVLGAGLALMLAPTDRAVARRSRTLARSARRLGRAAQHALEDAADERAPRVERRRFKL